MRGAMMAAAAALPGSILIASAADARGSRGSTSHGIRSHRAALRGSSGGGSGGGCSRSSPCTGPRGGVYYFTPGRAKQYLPR